MSVCLDGWRGLLQRWADLVPLSIALNRQITAIRQTIPVWERFVVYGGIRFANHALQNGVMWTRSVRQCKHPNVESDTQQQTRPK